MTICLAGSAPAAERTANKLWNDLTAKRSALPGVHQEFQVSRTYKSISGASRSSKRDLIVDMRQDLWREEWISGSGKETHIFDGTDLFMTEEGSTEFVRVKGDSKGEQFMPGEQLMPSPYSIELEWADASEAGRLSCGLSGRNDNCVMLDVPEKVWTRGNVTKLKQGAARVTVDLENGLILYFHMRELIDRPSAPYETDLLYTAKRLNDNAAIDASLFKFHSAVMHEVKKFSPWNGPRIRKEFAGKPAPDLKLTDITGKPVSISAFKGRVVLLDFWTTWCPPCRVDGPALDKLFAKYGAADLAIIGISVSEDRAVVEQFLTEHPHKYPVVLTTENEMSRPYEVGDFPTYIVIDRDGMITSAVSGDQGFGELRKLLKKAGLQTD